MLRTQYNTKQSLKGFTLIELLLVLVILASLAAIVVPKFSRRTEQANITAAGTQISGFETALEAFNIDLGRYPTNTEGLKALVQKPAGLEKWKEPYLTRSTIPLDPWGHEYIYKYPGQHNEYGYDLYSIGPDAQESSDDDITNWSNEDDTDR